MKIGIRFGHMTNGVDGGAVGILKETDVNGEYGPYVILYLRRAGHEVVDCTPSSAVDMGDSLNQGIAMANQSKCDKFVSLHVNAGGGVGSEVLYHGKSELGKTLAIQINNSIVRKCGYKDRGAKADVRGLAELKYTDMPSVIVEPFFLDSQCDCNLYNAEKLGKAIAEGIVGHDICDKPEPHWCQKNFDYLNSKGVSILETRFDDKMTRAEVFALLAQIVD